MRVNIVDHLDISISRILTTALKVGGILINNTRYIEKSKHYFFHNT